MFEPTNRRAVAHAAVAITLIVATTTLLGGCMRSSVVNRDQLILMSTQKEMELGTKAFAETLKKEPQCTNAAAAAHLRGIGTQIAQVSHKPGWAWDFRLLKKPILNAFALPGGKVAVFAALYKPLQNEASLAAVMGHEVAHAIARHGAERISRTMMVNAGLKAAQVAVEDPKQHDQIFGALGLGAHVGLMLPFSREMELEADGIGLMYMAKAGYDPNEAIAFWQRFGKLTGQQVELLSTHPASPTRVANLRKLMPKAMALYNQSAKRGKGRPLAVPSCP